MLASRAAAQLLVIDVQERLLPAISGAEPMLAGCQRLIEAARLAAVPTTVFEQNPAKLGATHPALLSAAGDAPVLAKMSFSALRDDAGHARVAHDPDRGQIVVCGIEAHVCVLQTAFDLKAAGFDVFVAADAIASRAPASRDVATARMRDAGISIVTSEMIVFEWAEQAGTDLFRALSRLVR